MTTSPGGTGKRRCPTRSQKRQTPQNSKPPDTHRVIVGEATLNPTPKGQDYTRSSTSQHSVSRASKNSGFLQPSRIFKSDQSEKASALV